MGPPGGTLTATSYRDLPHLESQLLGELLEEFQPGIISSVNADLSNILLHLKNSSGHYPLEQYSNEQIMEEKLTSEFFRKALVVKDRG